MGNIFSGTLEQWRNLFSEEITTFETPIKVLSRFKSDPRVLFHYLAKNRLIETGKYPSILEKTRAFQFNGEVLTAKQINAPKENTNYPNIGSYILIAQAIAKITN